MNTSFLAPAPCRPAGAPSPRRHKLIITGTGRAGTTFLIRLLTALGQDTGYDDANWRSDYFAHCEAGLERDLADPDAPYIVKDPELCVTLDAILRQGDVVVDHAIVPVRDLASAARSRVRIGGADGVVPGGLVGTDDPARQQAVLAERFHALVHTLVAREVPHTFLLFPRFVCDAEYAFDRLRSALPELDRARFMAAFAEIADPAMVHDFSAAPAPRSAAAERFEAERAAQRHSRHRRRLLSWTGATALGVSVVAWRWLALLAR